MRKRQTESRLDGSRPPVALITGVTGQDGSYLAEFLIQKGYKVYGIVRRSSSLNTRRIDHLFEEVHLQNKSFHLLFGDLSDTSSLNKILRMVRPDEIYHLGAQSHVRVSFDLPDYTAEVTGLGTLRLLEAIRETDMQPKLYHAASSEMFGKVQAIPQNERTPFYPRSPYGVAKVFGYWMTVNYREAYGVFACNGILFNHESPRRGETFVTRKISKAVARIKLGLQETLYLGNLEAKRDWGFAGDYVEAMWLMLQQERPDDYVIATGETHSVKDFLELAFGHVGLNWKKHVVHDPRYERPTEVDLLIGDATKARTVLGWKSKTSFPALVTMMVEHDLDAERRRMEGERDERSPVIDSLRNYEGVGLAL